MAPLFLSVFQSFFSLSLSFLKRKEKKAKPTWVCTGNVNGNVGEMLGKCWVSRQFFSCFVFSIDGVKSPAIFVFSTPTTCVFYTSGSPPRVPRGPPPLLLVNNCMYFLNYLLVIVSQGIFFSLLLLSLNHATHEMHAAALIYEGGGGRFRLFPFLFFFFFFFFFFFLSFFFSR